MKANKKKLKRQEIKLQKQDEIKKAQEEADRQLRLKLLSKECNDKRIPIHLFTNVDDYIDDRLPISRERQIEIIRSQEGLLNKMKILN
jgi:hypothetical protein